MKNGSYELVVADDKFPGKRYRGKYCYEHTLVWWRNYGFVPEKRECIHHKNGNKRDNRIDNLALFGKDEHADFHCWFPRGVKVVDMVCGQCKAMFSRRANQVSTKAKAGQTVFFCNRRCSGKYYGSKKKKPSEC